MREGERRSIISSLDIYSISQLNHIYIYIYIYITPGDAAAPEAAARTAADAGKEPEGSSVIAADNDDDENLHIVHFIIIDFHAYLKTYLTYDFAYYSSIVCHILQRDKYALSFSLSPSLSLSLSISLSLSLSLYIYIYIKCTC